MLQGNLSGLKGVVLLAQIAKHDNKDSRQDFGWCWVPAEEFNQNFQKHIVEADTAKDNDEILHQLLALSGIGLLPNNITTQVKAYRKSE